MKHIVESVEEMYHAREPTREVIIDEVVNAVRKTRTQRSSDIALLLDVEHRQLNDAFKMLTGMNLSTMIIEWRMMQARDLLDDKSLSVTEVAHRCGFKRQKNLILTFRRRWGTTPQAYRTGKLLRNSNYVVNKDYHSRKTALDIAKEHLSYRGGYAAIVVCPLMDVEGYAEVGRCPLTFAGGYAEVGRCPLTFVGGYAEMEVCPLTFIEGNAEMEACPITVVGGYAEVVAYPLMVITGYASIAACPLRFIAGHASKAACPLTVVKGYLLRSLEDMR